MTIDVKEKMAPEVQLFQMITGRFVSHCIYAAAKLGVADFLREKPLGVHKLAKLTSAHSEHLYRLLRTLASIGIFEETDKETFRLTPMASLLQTDVQGSLRNAALMYGSYYHVEAWNELLDSVQTGGIAFEKAHQKNVFEFLMDHPKNFETFSKTMTGISDMMNVPVADSYDFSKINTLVDIGGGHGSLLSTILQKNPNLNGILFDLPQVIEGARRNNRYSLQAGNFFEYIPAGGDAYLLKFILHDWKDEQAIQILRNCRHVIPSTGKLLIVEYLIPEQNTPSIAKFIDIEMMVMTGGKERTESEYRCLLEASGFELCRIIETGSPLVMIEARPVN